MQWAPSGFHNAKRSETTLPVPSIKMGPWRTSNEGQIGIEGGWELYKVVFDVSQQRVRLGAKKGQEG